jgi:hypothetical protein
MNVGPEDKKGGRKSNSISSDSANAKTILHLWDRDSEVKT